MLGFSFCCCSSIQHWRSCSIVKHRESSKNGKKKKFVDFFSHFDSTLRIFWGLIRNGGREKNGRTKMEVDSMNKKSFFNIISREMRTKIFAIFHRLRLPPSFMSLKFLVSSCRFAEEENWISLSSLVDDDDGDIEQHPYSWEREIARECIINEC